MFAACTFCGPDAPPSVTLPDTACNTPGSDFYSELNGTTIGVGGFIVWIFVLWCAGRIILSKQRRPAHCVTKFNRTTISRLLHFITITYAPVTEKVLALYSCRKIGDKTWLREETSKECSGSVYDTYARLGGWWVVFYIVGTPLLFLTLLCYYNVPIVARDLERTALLRACIDEAIHSDLHLPAGLSYHHISCANCPDDYLEALWRALHCLDIGGAKAVLAQKSHSPAAPVPPGHVDLFDGGSRGGVVVVEGSGCLGTSDEIETFSPNHLPVLSDSPRPIGTAVTREQKLAHLIAFARRNLRCSPVTWREAKGDPRLNGSHEAIGSLFKEFYAIRWYWCVVEIVNKLLITGVLGFSACPSWLACPARALPCVPWRALRGFSASAREASLR
jgi:hypothetical protein